MKLHLPLLLRRSLLMLAAALPTAYADGDERAAQPYFTYYFIKDESTYTEVPPTYVQDGGDFKITLGQDRPWLMTAKKMGSISFSNMNEISIENAWQTCNYGTEVSQGVKSPLTNFLSDSLNNANVRVNKAASFTYSGAHALSAYGSFLTEGTASFVDVDNILFNRNTGCYLAAVDSFFVKNTTGSVVFENNVASVLFDDAALTFQNCGSVIFRNNIGSIQKSGLLTKSSFTCSHTGSLEFSANRVTGDEFHPLFVVLFDDYTCVTLSDIDTVTFRGNTTVDGLIAGASLPNQTDSITDCDTVIFADNVTGEGVIVGAINISGVKNLTFSGNKAETEHAVGAVLANSSMYIDSGDYSERHVAGESIRITNCENLLFENNKVVGASYAAGSSLYGLFDIDVSSIVFRGNETASTEKEGFAHGGAMYFLDVTHTHTVKAKTITFENNVARADKALGGALYVSVSPYDTLNDEWHSFLKSEDLEFVGNKVVGSSVSAGGAVAGTESMAFEGFKSLIFRGNGAQGTSMESAKGGAIAKLTDTQTQHSFIIRGNDYVEFRGNYVTDGKTYHLNSFYSEESAPFVLAADAGKMIAVYDSFEVQQKVVFNDDPAKRSDEEYDYSTATGTILLSGKYAAEDLAKLKPNYTEEELHDSRRFLCGSCRITRGTLEIRDHAVLVADGPYTWLFGGKYYLASTSNPSFYSFGANVVMQDGGLAGIVVGTSDMEFYGANELEAVSYFEGSSGTWKFHVSQENKEKALLTIDSGSSATLKLKGLTFAVDFDSATLLKGQYKLLSFTDAAAARATMQNITCTGTLATTYNEEDVYFITENDAKTGESYTTLIFDYSYGPSSIVTRPATTLTWSGASGVWKENAESCWTGTVKDLKFYNKDTVVFNSAATVSLEGVVRPAAIQVSNASGEVTLNGSSGQIAGNASLAKTGAGTLNLNTANTYTGGTTISAGTVKAGNAAAFGLGDITLTGGTLAMGTQAVANKVTAKGGTLTGTAYKGALTVKGTVALGSGFKAGSLTLESGTLTGTVKTADVHTLNTGSGSISGGLTLNGGTIVFGNSPLSVSGALTISSATALDFSAYQADGAYTLISAGSVSGNLSALTYEDSVGRRSFIVSQSGSSLVLNVETSSAILYWTQVKGTWNQDAEMSGMGYADGDTVVIKSAAAMTLSGKLAPGAIEVDTAANVTLTADKKTAGSGLSGEGSVTKSGAGVLTLNAGNTYSGGTELNAGTIKATAADSFGSGVITVKGGTLDLASKAVTNDIVLSGTATLKGDAKYMGNVTVDGKATLLAKASYKGTTTIGEDSSLTLGAAATMAGNVALEGGTLTINNAKGMTLAKNQTMMLDGGTVQGLVTVGAGGALAWQEGTMQNAPVLKGGTLDLGGKNVLTLTGTKAQVQFGDKVVDLPGKGIVRSDETLDVLSGTVKLTMGKETTDAAITVSGNAALVNGATHSGDITVDGTLAKGTTIKLIDKHQTVNMNGAGITAAAISGIGIVNVNLNAGESIDATAAKLTAANINLNGGTFINTKGIKLAKGQTLTLNGANVNLGAKGILTTAAGCTLKVSESATLSGSLTLGGGELVFEGAALTVKGTLTLSKPVSVTGSGTLICDSVKPFKGDLGTLFGGADVKLDGTTLTINGGATKKSLVAAPVAEEEAPLDAAPALPTLPEMPATNPVADAIAQADWGILDANRAFTGAVATRHQHAALLDKGRGAAWVSAFGASVRHGNQGAHHGSDGNIEGAALGMEHSVSETGTVGLAVGRSKNRIGATGVTHLRQETAHVALYGQKQFKHNLTADATAAWGDTETKLGGSSWQQKSAALSGRLTQAHMVNDATAVRTFGGFSYEATESGSFGADSRSGSVQNLRAEVGAGATHTAGKAHFYGEASLTGDLIRHNPSVEMDGLRHHGATPGRLGVRGTFGVFYSLTDTWTGTASYSVEAESRSTSHTVNIGVSKSF